MEFNRRPLHDSAKEVLRHIARLWGFSVRLEVLKEDGSVELMQEFFV
jgi:spore cortex formation protein SpoVR/YcgB (stage V sporulation)